MESIIWKGILGTLNETDMCERYSRANVFILPSAIENSPNSLGEAMLVGIPVVATDVGGVKNLMTDKKEGYFYEKFKNACFINNI